MNTTPQAGNDLDLDELERLASNKLNGGLSLTKDEALALIALARRAAPATSGSASGEAWEGRRYCKGDQSWTDWAAMSSEEYERRKDDTSFEFRRTTPTASNAVGAVDERADLALQALENIANGAVDPVRYAQKAVAALAQQAASQPDTTASASADYNCYNCGGKESAHNEGCPALRTQAGASQPVQAGEAVDERALFIALQRRVDNIPDYIDDATIMKGEITQQQWIGFQAGRASLVPVSAIAPAKREVPEAEYSGPVLENAMEIGEATGWNACVDAMAAPVSAQQGAADESARLACVKCHSTKRENWDACYECGGKEFKTWADMTASWGAAKAPWEYCPECGCMETAEPEEGCGYFCANCKQEWHADIDYSEVVRKNLERLAAAKAPAAQAVTTQGVSKEECDEIAYANSGYRHFMDFPTFKAFRAECAASPATAPEAMTSDQQADEKLEMLIHKITGYEGEDDAFTYLRGALSELMDYRQKADAVHAQQPAAPYGYVLKTGHGNKFSEDLAHVSEEARHMWVKVYTAAPAPAGVDARCDECAGAGYFTPLGQLAAEPCDECQGTGRAAHQEPRHE